MLTTAITLLVLLKGQGGYTWASYSSSAGRYSLDMPGRVQTMVKPVSTEIGTIQMYSSYVDYGAKAFMMMYNDYPTAGDPDKVLAGVWRGQTGGKANLKVVNKKSVKWQGKSAIEAEFPYGSGAGLTDTRVRLLLDGKRLYQQMVIGIGGAVDRSAADRFFKSFKIK